MIAGRSKGRGSTLGDEFRVPTLTYGRIFLQNLQDPDESFFDRSMSGLHGMEKAHGHNIGFIILPVEISCLEYTARLREMVCSPAG